MAQDKPSKRIQKGPWDDDVNMWGILCNINIQIFLLLWAMFGTWKFWTKMCGKKIEMKSEKKRKKWMKIKNKFKTNKLFLYVF